MGERVEKCEAGCQHFYGGELKHDKNCVFYPESLSEMLANAQAENERLRAKEKDREYTKQRVHELVEEGPIGFWKSCSGCYETSEGVAVGHYPFNDIFDCCPGSGCMECGGIGVVWDDTDYPGMAEFIKLHATPNDDGEAG